jgi:UDP-glucose 4-epimerase
VRIPFSIVVTMRVLITGGAGYIGSFTARKLRDRGHQVTVYDNLSTGHRNNVPADHLVVGDLKDIDQLDQALVVHRIEAVLHFAASCYVGESVTNPNKYYTNNLLNGIHLIERMRRHRINRFVFSSSCAVYGLPTTDTLDESHPTKPVNPYGHTKLATEYMLADYAPAYGLGYVNLRYFNAAGASADGQYGEKHDPETHLIPLVLDVAMKKRANISIYGTDYPTPDGTCIRDYVHVEDLAEAHALALEKIEPGKGEVYNIGSGTGSSVQEVIRTCEEVTGSKIAIVKADRRAGDPPRLVASADKIRKALGWKPKYPDLHSIIDTAWNWHQRQA